MSRVFALRRGRAYSGVRIHMKKFKLLAAILAFVLGASCFLCGCSVVHSSGIIIVSGDSSGDRGQIITFYGTKSHTNELVAIEDAIGKFNASHPKINIVYEGVEGKAYYDALDKRIASETLDDIFVVDQKHLIKMSENNQLVDISSALDLSSYTDVIKTQFVNDDGSVYFVPMCVTTYNLYVNYDLLKLHNVSVPKTYAEFASVCDYFTSLGITPIVTNNGAAIRSLVMAKGMHTVYGNDKTKDLIDGFNSSPETLAPYLESGIDLVADMLGMGWIDSSEALVTSEADDDLKLFSAGDRPFMISGGWATLHVEEQNAKLNYGVHPFPILDDGSVLVTDVSSCAAINAASKNVDYALKFLSYFTQKNVMWSYCDSQNSYTVLVDSRTPSNKTLAPTTEHIRNDKCVLGSDYNLTILTDVILDACAGMLLNGAGVADVKAFLSEALIGG